MTSPLPWKVDDRLDKHIRILDANDSVICILPPRQMSNGYPPQELREKSAFIVHCVNNHEKLVDALRTMLVATDFNVPLPEGHPGHEAYLNVVAIPRAKQALQSAEI